MQTTPCLHATLMIIVLIKGSLKSFERCSCFATDILLLHVGTLRAETLKTLVKPAFLVSDRLDRFVDQLRLWSNLGKSSCSEVKKVSETGSGEYILTGPSPLDSSYSSSSSSHWRRKRYIYCSQETRDTIEMTTEEEKDTFTATSKPVTRKRW